MDYSNFETKEMRNMRIKQQIFDVALELMNHIGFDNITIRMICTEAGISTGMFYQHFSSKEDILAFYYDKAQVDYEHIVFDKLSSLPLDQKLVEFYVWICEMTAELGVDFCRNFFVSKNKLMNTAVFGNRLMDITNQCIEQSVEEGFALSKGRTPYKISKDLCVMVKGIIFDWSANEGKYDMPEYSRVLLNNCIKGLL